MKEFTYTINDSLGIHARPAGQLVRQASDFKSRITISMDDKEADAKKILGIMSLGVRRDHKIIVRADGEDESEAIEALSTLLKKNKF
jgi:phosphocarrier protein